MHVPSLVYQYGAALGMGVVQSRALTLLTWTKSEMGFAQPPSISVSQTVSVNRGPPVSNIPTLPTLPTLPCRRFLSGRCITLLRCVDRRVYLGNEE